MNFNLSNSDKCVEENEPNNIIELVSLVGIFLTFLLNSYQIYSEHKHELRCQSHGCCKFDIVVSDSE